MADTAALHREMLDVVAARNLDRLRELLHPEYTYMQGSATEQPGADAAVAVAQTYTQAFSDLSLDVRNQYSPSADVSIIELVARGTHTGVLEGVEPTGNAIEIAVCNVIEARDGKIHREREYFDGLTMLQQLGVTEQ